MSEGNFFSIRTTKMTNYMQEFQATGGPKKQNFY